MRLCQVQITITNLLPSATETAHLRPMIYSPSYPHKPGHSCRDLAEMVLHLVAGVGPASPGTGKAALGYCSAQADLHSLGYIRMHLLPSVSGAFAHIVLFAHTLFPYSDSLPHVD